MKILLLPRGMAALELLFIIFSMLLVFALIIPFISGFSDEKPSPGVKCRSNQRQIIILIQMYAQDHDEKLPLSSNVWKKIDDKDYSVFVCPGDKNLTNGYLYNNNISGIEMGLIEDPTLSIVTVDGKTTIEPGRKFNNIYYTPTDVQYRHHNMAFASYVDGHTTMIGNVTEPESWDKEVGIIKPSQSKANKK